jgi:S-DNA-T family DNA segregation ATPase FtsK/SpoIIIE
MKKQEKHSSLLISSINGISLLLISILGFLSLLSFNIHYPSSNYLGIAGYFLALSLTYLFGLASYLLFAFVFWKGFLLIYQKPVLIYKIPSLIMLVISTSFLLTILSEMNPSIASLLSSKIIITSSPLRYNLGGIPFYFIYKDIPIFNLQHLFSNFGNILLFSISAFIALLIISDFRLLQKMKTITIKTTLLLFKLTTVLVKKLYFAIKKYLTEESTIPTPQREKISIPKKEIKTATPTIQEPIIKEAKKFLPTLKKNVEITGQDPDYKYPSADLLTKPAPVDHPSLKKELTRQAKILEETLANFNISAFVGEINCGPTIASFEVHPAIGVKVQKIKTLENDIALNLKAKSIRIVAPIPGKAAVGVEVPSPYPHQVSFKEMLLHYRQTAKKMSIPILLGKTVSGDNVITDLTRMPHCLIAGATGSGKSVCINTIVMSILMNASPNDVKLILIDPKKVELTQYSSLPHMIAPVVTEPNGAYAAMQWLVREMKHRYDILKYSQTRNILAFNSRKNKQIKDAPFEIPEHLPLIVTIIDEFADLMMVSSSDLETPIARIAQMARAVGIHLVLATQRPSREVITGIIKANFPSRVAFKVASRINSQIILDENGAESLLGNGDLLFQPPGSSILVRAQGAYISDEDINKVIEATSDRHPANYLIPSFDAMQIEPEEKNNMDSEGKDDLYDQALTIVLQSKNASTTFLQRKLKIGYARAASIIDEMEENGIIGPQEGSRPRRILKNF